MCKRIFPALALMMVSGWLQAQCLGSCCSAGCSTDITNHSFNSHKGDWRITTAYSAMQFHPFTEDELKQYSDSLNAAFTVTSVQSARVAVQYNVTDRWKVSAALPYNLSFANKEGHTHEGDYKEIHDYENVRGWGDATLIVSYNVVNDESKHFTLACGAGIKTPTGQTDVRSSNNIGLPPHLEPGTGSWDPVITAEAQKQWQRWIGTAEFFARKATTANDHNMGNYASTTVTSFWKASDHPENFLSSIMLFGALQFDYNSKIKMPPNHLHAGGSGDTDPGDTITPFDNSGFQRLFLSGGAFISLGKHFTIPFSASLPVIQHLNGYQVKMEWKATIGLTLNI